MAKILSPHVHSLFFGRHVDSTRVEGCLNAYCHYQETKDQEALKKKLEAFNTSPREFQQIIDRFIHYRISKSSMDQAMKFLKAFENGASIHATGVLENGPQAHLPYEVEAEIIRVIKDKPYLVQQAFGG